MIFPPWFLKQTLLTSSPFQQRRGKWAAHVILTLVPYSLQERGHRDWHVYGDWSSVCCLGLQSPCSYPGGLRWDLRLFCPRQTDHLIHPGLPFIKTVSFLVPRPSEQKTRLQSPSGEMGLDSWCERSWHCPSGAAQPPKVGAGQLHRGVNHALELSCPSLSYPAGVYVALLHKMRSVPIS